MMRIFTDDQELILTGASYLRFMSVSYLCWGITEVYLAALRSVGRVAVSMAMNMLAFSLNICLNAVFIFGLFGAPKLGAPGVAIATSLSRAVELSACSYETGFCSLILYSSLFLPLETTLAGAPPILCIP